MTLHSSAVVDPVAQIDSTTTVGPHVVIEGPVTIGPGCQIGPAATIIGHTTIGAGCRIESHAVIGDVPQDYKYQNELTYCRIGDECVIREGVTIHRASREGQATIVGDRCHLMTNSHIGHDCVLQDEVTLQSGVLLGGHVQVGNRTVISANVGVHQFVRIGELAMIGSVAMIAQDVPPYLMTDDDGKIVGLNAIGLNLAGIDPEIGQEIKALFKIVYRSGMPFQKARELAEEFKVSDFGDRFLQFFESGSARGFRKESS